MKTEKLLVDLHTHSTASDGQYSPKELVELVKNRHICLFSLTDHDSISGLEEAGYTANELDLKFIPGIEISSQDIEEIHILGYDIDYYNTELIEACNFFFEERNNRGKKICEYLKEKGISVDYSEVKEYAKDGVVGRPHFARYLVEHEVVNNRKEAFKKYLDTGEFKMATDRKKPSLEEAIDLIHLAGGKAMLAHPGLYRMNDILLDELVKRLVEFNIDAIECFYSKHSIEQTKKYLSYVKKYNLKTGCGSDFHGEKVKPEVKIGMEFDWENYGDILLFDEKGYIK